VIRAIVSALAFASLGFSAIEVYLTLNKLWKRKHERAVAQSISIMGRIVGLVPLLFFTLNYVFEAQWQGVIDGALWLFTGLVTVAIGTGFWIEGERKKGLWALIKESLRLERQEAGDLAKSLFRPSGARLVLDILAQIALIDEHLDEREKAYIHSFADSWGINIAWEDLIAGRAPGGHINYINLRKSLAHYLATSPPVPQVSQLGDILHALVTVDET
jgi:hypothetical protein